MAPLILTHRIKSDTTANNVPTTPRTRNEAKKAKAKRAIRSLAIAILVPVCLTLTNTILFGSSPKYNALTKPFYFPPLWLIHSAAMATSFLMGFAAWLVWAEGGFHKGSCALPLFISHLCLALLWDPLVFSIEGVLLAFVLCALHLGTLVGCYKSFKSLNPIAGDLVRPCLVWLAYLTFVNFKLIHIF